MHVRVCIKVPKLKTTPVVQGFMKYPDVLKLRIKGPSGPFRASDLGRVCQVLFVTRLAFDSKLFIMSPIVFGV